MLDIWWKNIRNKKLIIKSFLERYLVEEKPISSIFLPIPTSNSLPELVNSVERYDTRLNQDQIITAVNDILLRAQACIESEVFRISNDRGWYWKLVVIYVQLW